MRRIKILVYKIWRCVRIYFRTLSRKRPASSDSVLLIQGGGIGDALLDAQAVAALAKRYVAMGKSVHVITSSKSSPVYKTVIDLPNVSFFECDFLISNSWSKDVSLKNTVNILKNFEYELIVLRFIRNAVKPLFLLDSLSVKHTVAFLCSHPVRMKSRLICLFIRSIADETIESSSGSFYADQSRELAMTLGAEEYKTKIQYLPKQCDYECPAGQYVTITVDSANSARKWATEKFILLIQNLLDRYDYNIILTGSNVPQSVLAQYEQAFCNCSRVKNMIGRLKLSEWIELIRGSSFHIGVDSGSIHVAASVGTQAFCLTGVWDNGGFLPYQVEEKTDGTAEPICIYRKDVDVDWLSCRNCAPKGGYGWGNKECYARCKAEQPCLCLERITVDDVMETIDRWMNMKAEK